MSELGDRTTPTGLSPTRAHEHDVAPPLAARLWRLGLALSSRTFPLLDLHTLRARHHFETSTRLAGALCVLYEMSIWAHVR